MYKMLKTYAKINRNNNPVVCLQVGETIFELSIIEAKQLAMGIISTAEKAVITQKLEDMLVVDVGQDKAKLLIYNIQQILEGEE